MFSLKFYFLLVRLCSSILVIQHSKFSAWISLWLLRFSGRNLLFFSFCGIPLFLFTGSSLYLYMTVPEKLHSGFWPNFCLLLLLPSHLSFANLSVSSIIHIGFSCLFTTGMVFLHTHTPIPYSSLSEGALGRKSFSYPSGALWWKSGVVVGVCVRLQGTDVPMYDSSLTAGARDRKSFPTPRILPWGMHLIFGASNTQKNTVSVVLQYVSMDLWG